MQNNNLQPPPGLQRKQSKPALQLPEIYNPRPNDRIGSKRAGSISVAQQQAQQQRLNINMSPLSGQRYQQPASNLISNKRKV